MKDKKKSLKLWLLLIFGISVAIVTVALLLNVTDYGITIAAFGASIFMIFSRSKIDKRKLFGSYLIATVVGYLFSRLPLFQSLNVALAAVLSVLVMTVLEFQHAPAVGVSAAMVLNRFNFWTDFFVLLGIAFVLATAIVLKTLLNDPDKVLNYIQIEKEKIKWDF